MNGSKAGVILDPIRPQFAPVNAPSIQASWALHYSVFTSHPPSSTLFILSRTSSIFTHLEYTNLKTYCYPLLWSTFGELSFQVPAKTWLWTKMGGKGTGRFLNFSNPVILFFAGKTQDPPVFGCIWVHNQLHNRPSCHQSQLLGGPAFRFRNKFHSAEPFLLCGEEWRRVLWAWLPTQLLGRYRT